jgi:UDP-N-acetylmuramoyl-tripeptide--D-alanyl-D-alanine ligase
MLVALQTLADLPCNGRRVAVLGDMTELGTHTAKAHEDVGRRAAELKIDLLVGVGKFAQSTVDSAAGAGLRNVITFPDVKAVCADVKSLFRPGDLVLLKASRATALERVGEALRNAV